MANKKLLINLIKEYSVDRYSGKINRMFDVYAISFKRKIVSFKISGLTERVSFDDVYLMQHHEKSLSIIPTYAFVDFIPEDEWQDKNLAYVIKNFYIAKRRMRLSIPSLEDIKEWKDKEWELQDFGFTMRMLKKNAKKSQIGYLIMQVKIT